MRTFIPIHEPIKTLENLLFECLARNTLCAAMPPDIKNVDKISVNSIATLLFPPNVRFTFANWDYITCCFSEKRKIWKSEYSHQLQSFRMHVFLHIDSCTEKNFTLTSNIFQGAESTMCFIVESIRILIDSTTKQIVDSDLRKILVPDFFGSHS